MRRLLGRRIASATYRGRDEALARVGGAKDRAVLAAGHGSRREGGGCGEAPSRVQRHDSFPETLKAAIARDVLELIRLVVRWLPVSELDSRLDVRRVGPSFIKSRYSLGYSGRGRQLSKRCSSGSASSGTSLTLVRLTADGYQPWWIHT
jgi:hypothetical protein